MPKVLEIETSTRVLPVAEIKMFHAKAVAAWRGMVAAGQEKLGGVHSGLGMIGSPGWVITGSLVLGAIEGALSSANSKVGLKMLGEAGTFMTEIQERGVFIPVGQISGLRSPQPDAWYATHEGKAFISLGDDFIQVRTVDSAEMIIRWSAISSVRLC
ncbi:hypothetical protein [Sphingomonas sp. PAMC 26605]|uniref:hypothetical protein n=1 Tax=Sphingomonas sp. PAMC 26605 TaxID=1112214 RepID=UPI00026CDCD1|nr:hypothetical protein [Sphingomonas sp. PAMC 26605]